MPAYEHARRRQEKAQEKKASSKLAAATGKKQKKAAADDDDDASSSSDKEVVEAAATTTTTAAAPAVAASPVNKKKRLGPVTATAAAAAAPPQTPVQLQFNEPSVWVERMALTGTKSLPADLAADDDPKREEIFIQHALLSVLRGISLLEKAKVPWRRPADYYAEMFKDDGHMNKIKESIHRSKKQVELQAHRRTMKDQKKFGKEVQAEVLRQRAKHKRDLDDRLSDWKRKTKGNDRDDLDDVINQDDDETGAPKKKSRRETGGGGGRSRSAAPKPKNFRPGGGGSKKRPGKNSRNRSS